MSVTFILLSRFISEWLFWDVSCIAVNYFVRYLDGILLNFRSNVSTCHQRLDTSFSFFWDNHFTSTIYVSLLEMMSKQCGF